MKFTSCPTTFFSPPYSPLCIVGVHIYFFPSPTRMVEFLPNPNPERSEWNYLSWHNQIITPISFRFQIWHSISEFQIKIRHWL